MADHKTTVEVKFIMEKKLVRSSNEKMVWGVAAGIADYLNVDPVLVRLLFVILTLTGGPGLILYIILAIIMPEALTPSAKANGFDEEEIVIQDA